MNRIICISALALTALSLTACGEKNATQSTTKMTNVEVVDGTISDDMILLDTSQGDGTSVDNSATGGLYETVDNRPKPEAPKAAAKKSDSPDAPAAKAPAEPEATPATPEAEPK